MIIKMEATTEGAMMVALEVATLEEKIVEVVEGEGEVVTLQEGAIVTLEEEEIVEEVEGEEEVVTLEEEAGEEDIVEEEEVVEGEEEVVEEVVEVVEMIRIRSDGCY